MIETVEGLRASLQRHLDASYQQAHALGGTLAKRWYSLAVDDRRALQRLLAKEHRHSRWLLTLINDRKFLAAWCARINRARQEDARRRAEQQEAERQRLDAMTAQERAQAALDAECARVMYTGLFTRDVQ